MSKSLRDRRNRRDTSQRLIEVFLGVVVTATAYNGDVRMVDCYAPIPHSAEFAGSCADGLLPTDD